MTTALYLQCLLAATLGGMFQTMMKLKSIRDKSRMANVQFSAKQFLADDWFIMVGNQIFIFICLLVIGEWAKPDTVFMDKIKSLFVFIGWAGSDLALRLFSYADKRVNAAIDYKTTQIDTINNTADKPTPAVMPKDTPK
jgi:hypothetical protein